MGNVFISPNVKKESVQIDINGNEVVPFTKEVLKKNEEHKISPEEVEKAIEATKDNKNESLLSGE